MTTVRTQNPYPNAPCRPARSQSINGSMSAASTCSAISSACDYLGESRPPRPGHRRPHAWRVGACQFRVVTASS